MGYQIITDSCSNLPESLIDDFDLVVFPMTFIVDGKQHQSYLKGTKTDLKQFYTMMREGNVITTSLPNLENAESVMRGLLGQGEDIIYIGFSSGLSGTFQAIDLIMQNLQADFPERKAYAVDTLAASGGEGLLVWYAAQKKRTGATIDEVREWLEDNKLHLAHWFTVDDLMFLLRGGRVSRTSAWAGTILNIKPVMHVDDEGHLIPVSKVRGRRKSLDAMIGHFEQTANRPTSEQMVFIFHGDCIEDAEYVAERIRGQFGVKDILINYIDPVIGAHSGPGTMAIFFLASER